MARNENGEVAARAEAPGGACRTRRAGERRKLPVGDDLAPRNLAKGARAAREEGGLVLEIDRNLLERDPFACEVRLEQLHDIRNETVGSPRHLT